MKVISFNGSDGIGKTQQIGLLKNESELNFTGKLIDYTSRWPKLNSAEDFNWWFRDVPFLDLVSIIIEAIKARRLSYSSNKININDRGTRMFKAVCTATLIVREQLIVEEAVERVERLFNDELGVNEQEQEIFFRANPEYSAKIKPILTVVNSKSHQYLAWQSKLYTEYQMWLAHLMDHYFLNESSVRIIQVDSCILEIQNKLRDVLNEMTGVYLQPICKNLEKIIAFGGLSESGKSSFAEKLSKHHKYYRLKIKYFDGVIRSRGAQSNPLTIGKELLDFLHNHKHVTHASVESLHNVDLPAYFKLLFGKKVKVVFLDTPEILRVRRTAKELDISQDEARCRTLEKDKMKILEGADRVKDIADIVFSNESDDFETSFQTFVNCL